MEEDTGSVTLVIKLVSMSAPGTLQTHWEKKKILLGLALVVTLAFSSLSVISFLSNRLNGAEPQNASSELLCEDKN